MTCGRSLGVYFTHDLTGQLNDLRQDIAITKENYIYLIELDDKEVTL